LAAPVRSPSGANAVEPFVPIEEAARFLAVPLSWLYEQAAKGKVPSRKIGKYRRFKLSELAAWAERQ
jgi:excisionase family DNA binding protein